MQGTGNPTEHIDVFSNTLDFRTIVKVSGADRPSDDIPGPIAASGDKLLLFHGIKQLCMDLTRLTNAFGMNKVFRAPFSVEVVLLHPLVYVQ